MTPSQTAHPTEGEVKLLVDRFLSWKLPETFSPDCGISFKPLEPRPPHSWPIGTNLLCATEAEAMLRHVLDIQPSAVVQPVEQELLPCPFCGGGPALKEWATFYVECHDCNARQIGLTEAEAITTWNTRPDVRPQGEEGLVGKWRGQADGSRGLMLGAGRSDGLRHNAIADTLDACADDLARLSNQGKPSS